MLKTLGDKTRERERAYVTEYVTIRFELTAARPMFTPSTSGMLPSLGASVAFTVPQVLLAGVRFD